MCVFVCSLRRLRSISNSIRESGPRECIRGKLRQTRPDEQSSQQVAQMENNKNSIINLYYM